MLLSYMNMFLKCANMWEIAYHNPNYDSAIPFS